MKRMSENDGARVQEAIRRRASELYQRSGAVAGHDVENWYQAEAEILRELAAAPVRRAIVVNVEGVVYTGEYKPAYAGGYTPGEWKPGDRVPIRLAGDKLFLRRPNGRELETDVVQKIG